MMEDQLNDHTDEMRIENESMGRTKQSAVCVSFLKRNLLILLVLLGVAVGFCVGFGAREAKPSEEATIWIGLPGELYMRMLKMTILPLVVSTIITGTASLNPKDNGKLGVMSLGYLILTNGVGAVLAVILFFAFKPGDVVQIPSQTEMSIKSTQLQTNDMFVDMIRNLLPDNMVTACFQKTQTYYFKDITREANGTNFTTVYTRAVGKTDGVNILGIIVICVIIGIATAKVGETGRPFINFFTAMAEIIMTVLKWFIWFTPIGVASLIAAAILKVTNISDTFQSLGMFIACFLTGIIVHQLLLVPLSYFCIMRRSPLKFIVSAARPMMTAFAPPSTAVSMPEMLNTLENVNGVDPRVSRFVVPIGASLGRFGSCMFICLSALFLVKVEKSSIAVTEVIVITILSTMGSLAVPAVPSSSLIVIMIIASSLSVQVYNIGLLLALEWFTDRVRTTSNVETIVLGGVLINHFCRKSLQKVTENGKYAEINGKAQDNLLQNEKI